MPYRATIIRLLQRRKGPFDDILIALLLSINADNVWPNCFWPLRDEIKTAETSHNKALCACVRFWDCCAEKKGPQRVFNHGSFRHGEKWNYEVSRFMMWGREASEQIQRNSLETLLMLRASKTALWYLTADMSHYRHETAIKRRRSSIPCFRSLPRLQKFFFKRRIGFSKIKTSAVASLHL